MSAGIEPASRSSLNKRTNNELKRKGEGELKEGPYNVDLKPINHFCKITPLKSGRGSGSVYMPGEKRSSRCRRRRMSRVVGP